MTANSVRYLAQYKLFIVLYCIILYCMYNLWCFIDEVHLGTSYKSRELCVINVPSKSWGIQTTTPEGAGVNNSFLEDLFNMWLLSVVHGRLEYYSAGKCGTI